MSSKQFYDEEQDLDIEVVPGGSVVLVVNLDDVHRNGGSVELSADLMARIVAAWSKRAEPGEWEGPSYSRRYS